MKKCSKCKCEKPLSNFHESKKRGTQAVCKPCRKEVDREYWKRRSSNDLKMEKKKCYQEARRKKRREFIYGFLSDNPCVDCGETDPIVLTFDHVRDKKFTIATKVMSVSQEELINEIKKCEIRCGNCHMRKTAQQFNWYEHEKNRETRGMA